MLKLKQYLFSTATNNVIISVFIGFQFDWNTLMQEHSKQNKMTALKDHHLFFRTRNSE